MQSPKSLLAFGVSAVVAATAIAASPVAAEPGLLRRPSSPPEGAASPPTDQTAEDPEASSELAQNSTEQRFDRLQQQIEIRQQLNDAQFQTPPQDSSGINSLQLEQEAQQQINLQDLNNMRQSIGTTSSDSLDRLQFEQRVRQRLQQPNAPQSKVTIAQTTGTSTPVEASEPTPPSTLPSVAVESPSEPPQVAESTPAVPENSEAAKATQPETTQSETTEAENPGTVPAMPAAPVLEAAEIPAPAEVKPETPPRPSAQPSNPYARSGRRSQTVETAQNQAETAAPAPEAITESAIESPAASEAEGSAIEVEPESIAQESVAQDTPASTPEVAAETESTAETIEIPTPEAPEATAEVEPEEKLEPEAEAVAAEAAVETAESEVEIAAEEKPEPETEAVAAEPEVAVEAEEAETEPKEEVEAEAESEVEIAAEEKLEPEAEAVAAEAAVETAEPEAEIAAEEKPEPETEAVAAEPEVAVEAEEAEAEPKEEVEAEAESEVEIAAEEKPEPETEAVAAEPEVEAEEAEAEPEPDVQAEAESEEEEEEEAAAEPEADSQKRSRTTEQAEDQIDRQNRDYSNDAEAPAPEYLDPDANPLSFPTEPEEVDWVGTQPITLQQAVQLAIRNNPVLQQERFQLERAQFSLREAEATNYPTLDATASFNQRGQETFQEERQQLAPTNDPQQPLTTVTVPSETIYTDSTALGANLELSYPIYTSGRRSSLIQAAQGQVRLQQLELERQTEDLILNTTQDYYDLQQASAQVNIFTANLTEAEQSLRDAQSLERAGVGTRFDVLQAEVDVANARQELTQQLSQLEIARRQLAQRLSLAESLNIEAADVIEVAGVWELSLPETVVQAYKNRAELEQQLIQREIAQKNRQAALAQLGPQLFFNGSFGVTNDLDRDPGFLYNYQLGLTASLSLYDGGEARAQADQQESNIAIAESEFQNVRDQIRFQVEQAYSQLDSNFANIQTTALAVEQAAEALRLARLRFQAGVGTQTDVLRQQTALAQAQVNNLRAILDYNRAIASLQRQVSNYPEGALNEQP